MLNGAPMRRFILLVTGIFVPSCLLAAPPRALSQVSGGLWEIIGAPGSKAALRECIADVLSLAQFEHRTRSCSRDIVTDKDASTVVSYSCGGSDFGESQIDVITPRSLRISTQGISGQLPFNYVLQARRLGDCTNAAQDTRH